MGGSERRGKESERAGSTTGAQPDMRSGVRNKGGVGASGGRGMTRTKGRPGETTVARTRGPYGHVDETHDALQRFPWHQPTINKQNRVHIGLATAGLGYK